MKFGSLPVAESNGVLLAHAIRRPGLTLKKGEWIGAGQIAALQAAGISEIIVACAEPGEVGENEAAGRLAESLAGAHVHRDRAYTGRCNLMAGCNGVLLADAPVIDRVNLVDESITLATLLPFRRVVEGEMIATAKIIPFAVARDTLDRAVAIASEAPLCVAPFRPFRVGVVSTLLPGLKPSTVTKTLHVFDERLARAGSRIAVEERVPHETAPLVAALHRIESESDLIVVFGASAITDRRDIVPSAIEKAGGRIEHFGMPVDPGNLLLLGSLPGAAAEKPVIGAPGCARSPKENGFDFVLNRILAGIPVRSADIRRMGVGGLLLEIVTRPEPSAISDG